MVSRFSLERHRFIALQPTLPARLTVEALPSVHSFRPPLSLTPSFPFSVSLLLTVYLPPTRLGTIKRPPPVSHRLPLAAYRLLPAASRSPPDHPTARPPHTPSPPSLPAPLPARLEGSSPRRAEQRHGSELGLCVRDGTCLELSTNARATARHGTARRGERQVDPSHAELCRAVPCHAAARPPRATPLCDHTVLARAVPAPTTSHHQPSNHTPRPRPLPYSPPPSPHLSLRHLSLGESS